MRIIAIASLAALLLSSDLLAADAAGDSATFWLDQIDLKAIQQRRGVPLANLAVGGGKLVMDGKTYERGIGTRSISELVLDLHGEAKRFSAMVGLDGLHGSYAIDVPSHGAVMLKIGRAK